MDNNIVCGSNQLPNVNALSLSLSLSRRVNTRLCIFGVTDIDIDLHRIKKKIKMALCGTFDPLVSVTVSGWRKTNINRHSGKEPSVFLCCFFIFCFILLSSSFIYIRLVFKCPKNVLYPAEPKSLPQRDEIHLLFNACKTVA